MFTVGAVIDSGRATAAGGAATLTDASKLWGTNVLAGFLVTITGGTGVGQIHQIASNTNTVLTVSPSWTTAPSTDSVYEILLASNVTLVAGDLQIGAVEIKNSTDDTRATVGANGLAVYLPASTVTTLTPPTAAATASAQLGGVGTPQANLATDGAGAWAAVAIPANTKYVDFLVDVAAYVVANAVATTPFGSNTGVPYQPNLNLRLPCFGATYLHLKGTSAAVHTLKWSSIA